MFRTYLIVLFLLSLAVCNASAQTTAFTYQGKLNDGANPANGNYDIQFKLFDTATVGTGTQQGSTITNGSITVNAGVFAAQLDFGLPAFSGSPRYLELGVRPSGSPNAYTVLGPRSPVSSAPYSVRSLNSAVADTLSSACVGCVTGTQISSLPAGSTSYVQNTTSAQAANFNITGTGTASILAATTQFNIGGNRVLAIGNPGANNLFAGIGAGQSNTGVTNAFFGAGAGLSNTSGSGNSMFGANAGIANTIGGNNSFFGSASANANTTGNSNSFFGAASGALNTSGNANSFFGRSAGVSNTVGNNNSFFGSESGDLNTTGNGNSFFGTASGGSNTTGSANSFFGISAGNSNTIGTNNAFFGETAGYNNTTGDGNTFIGRTNGVSNTVGSNNTSIGSNADMGANNLTFATAIGAGAIVSASNTVVLGRGGDNVIVPGNLFVITLGTGGSTSICATAAGKISTCSSSLRYKTSVQTFSDGLDIVRRLRPITFDWKESGTRDIGFGAEEVNEIEPLLTTRNSKGEIEGVKYAQITTVLVNAVNEQQTEIESQRKQISYQRKQIQSQQKLIDGLKQLVCGKNSDAEICKEK